MKSLVGGPLMGGLGPGSPCHPPSSHALKSGPVVQYNIFKQVCLPDLQLLVYFCFVFCFICKLQRHFSRWGKGRDKKLLHAGGKCIPSCPLQ